MLNRFVKYFLVTILVVLFHQNSLAQSGRKLLVGTDYAYYPYEYVNEFHQAEGFDVDIIKAVAHEIKYDVEFKPSNWGSVKAELESGNIDLIAGMYYLPDRAEKVNFSMPYIIVTHSIFVKEGDYWASLKDVKDELNLNVVVENSSILHSYLTTAGIASNRIIPVENQLDALKILSETPNTCALLPTLQGQFIAERNGFDDVAIVGLPILPREYSIAIKKTDTLLLSQINDAITTIHKNGTYAKIYDKWFGQYEKHQNTSSRVTYIEIILALSLLITLLAAFLLIRKIRIQNKILGGKLELIEAENIRVNNLLNKNENTIRKATENTPFPLAIISSSGNFVYVNRLFEDEFGYTRREIINLKSWVRIFFPIPTEQAQIQEKLEEILGHMAHDLNFNASQCDIIPFIDAEKNKKYYNLHVVSLGEGQILFLFNNITNVIEAHQKLEMFVKQHDIRNNVIINYLSNLENDFKAPITDIIGFSTLLSNDDTPKTEVKTLARLIKQNGESLIEIINNMIDFSKIEIGKDGLLNETTDIGLLLNEIYEENRTGLINNLKQPVQFLLKLPVSGNNLPFYANIDKIRFKHILQGIISQLLHFADNSVMELGFYNSDHDILRVFIKTYSNNTFTTNNTVGDQNAIQNNEAKLGLSLMAELTRVLGLELKTKTDVENGNFTYLDLQLVNPDNYLSDNSAAIPSADDDLQDILWPEKSILLVEDNMENSNYIEAILGKMYCSIITKDTGKEAIDVLKKNIPIDLIILDWLLPDISGDQVADFARNKMPDVPIIVVSAMESDNISEFRKIHKIDYFLEKPVHRATLIKTINSIFSR